MGLFVKVEGAAVITSAKGVQRQADVFVRDDRLFARYGSGFIGLSDSGSVKGTTIPNVVWLYIEGVEYTTNNIGWLMHKPKRGR